MPRSAALFIIDPPERLDPPTDTSLAIMRETLRRGAEAFVCHLPDLRLEDGRAAVRARPVSFCASQELYQAGEPADLDPQDLAAVYMRKDPPIDAAYLHATYVLDRFPASVLQVNPARALQRHCEKLIPADFTGLQPPSLVSACARQLAEFLHREGHIVLKPLDDCSGRGIVQLRSDDPKAVSQIERAVAAERFVQAQRFLAQIEEGDKRVLLLGGEILGWVRRLPAPGDFRSNVNAGGRCVPCDLTSNDRAICERLRPWLVREEIHLAGVDIVGEHVLEVNITSPSCLREINALTGSALERAIVDYVQERNRSAGA